MIHACRRKGKGRENDHDGCRTLVCLRKGYDHPFFNSLTSMAWKFRDLVVSGTASMNLSSPISRSLLVFLKLSEIGTRPLCSRSNTSVDLSRTVNDIPGGIMVMAGPSWLDAFSLWFDEETTLWTVIEVLRHHQT